MNRKQEITRTLPDIKLQRIDNDKIKNILEKTINWYLDFLKNNRIHVPMVEKTIYGVGEPGPMGIPALNIDFPCYDRIDGEKRMAPGDGRELNEFYEYMWEKGAFKITLTGPNPDKESWKPWVFKKYIETPVISGLIDEAHDEAAEAGKITLWKLPVSKKSDMVRKIVDQIAGQKTIYTATCSLPYVNHSGKSKEYKLSNNMYLKLYSAKDLLFHISKHRDKFDCVDLQRYVFDEKVLLIEVTGSISPKLIETPYEIHNKKIRAIPLIENDICDTIDLFKWALMFGNKPISDLGEDFVVYDDTIGNKLAMTAYGCFRRQARTRGAKVYDFDDIDLISVKLLMKKARKAMKQLPDLKQAFGYWGRSYVSQTHRDGVLDAVIGLESLLASSGENGGIPLGFSLCGTVLLAGDDSEVARIKKDLKIIYEERGDSKALLGFTYLSKVIFRVVELHDQGIIKKGAKISSQIESFLYENGYKCLRVKKVLGPTNIERIS